MSKQTEAESPDPIDVEVGHRMRLRRKSLGITQTGLAVHLGISFQQVQKYERGVNRVSASMLVHTARFLRMTVADLVGETPDARANEELLEQLSVPGTVPLVQAYARVQPSLRGAVLQLVRVMADEADRLPQGDE